MEVHRETAETTQPGAAVLRARSPHWCRDTIVTQVLLDRPLCYEGAWFERL